MLFVARLVPEKRVEDLIRAFRAVDTRVRLAIVGDSSHTDAYAATGKLRREAGGRRARRLLRRAAAGQRRAALPRRHRLRAAVGLEGMSMALLQALEMGVPSIVSGLPVHHELLDRVEGYDLFFAPGDVGALQERLHRLLTQRDRYQRVALRAGLHPPSPLVAGDRRSRPSRLYRIAGAARRRRRCRRAGRSARRPAPPRRSGDEPARRAAAGGAAAAGRAHRRRRRGAPRRPSPRPGCACRWSCPVTTSARLAVAAVESLLRQSLAALEVIAVDDGSTDDTLARLLALDDPRLTVVTQANRGLAAVASATPASATPARR
ncbi:MAG: glycosyltransferase [Candidatus Binatia bacterium]